MPPKYYCDYCDKQFHDTPAARRRHTQGSMHQRAKKQWFDSFKDQENVRQGVCSYYMRTGFCVYGQNCKYLHPIQPGLSQLHGNPSGFSVHGQSRDPNSTLPAVLTFGSAAGESATTIFESMLPPSLLPPPDGGYPHLPEVEWG